MNCFTWKDYSKNKCWNKNQSSQTSAVVWSILSWKIWSYVWIITVKNRGLCASNVQSPILNLIWGWISLPSKGTPSLTASQWTPATTATPSCIDALLLGQEFLLSMRWCGTSWRRSQWRSWRNTWECSSRPLSGHSIETPQGMHSCG